MSWAQEEFKDLDLKDARLDMRVVLLTERLGEKPTESIPTACSGWAETQAAYRFLSNVLILKEGCRIEALQLESVSRIEAALALYMVVAWRIHRLLRLGRTLALP